MNNQKTQRMHTRRIIIFWLVVTCLFTSHLALANPNPLSGLAGLLYTGMVLLAIVVLIMIFFSHRVSHRFAKFFLALPAIIWVIFSLPLLFRWEYSSLTLFMIVTCLMFSIILVFIYFPVFKLNHKKPVINILVLSFSLALLFNPAYFNLIGTDYINNDPFNGESHRVKEIIEAGYVYTENNKQYRIDNYLVLNDGRIIPGIFHGF